MHRWGHFDGVDLFQVSLFTTSIFFLNHPNASPRFSLHHHSTFLQLPSISVSLFTISEAKYPSLLTSPSDALPTTPLCRCSLNYPSLFFSLYHPSFSLFTTLLFLSLPPLCFFFCLPPSPFLSLPPLPVSVFIPLPEF